MLAIVIPYYKKTFFRQTLQALANQTDKRFHVYIGNDASSDDPMELLEEFKDQFDFTYKKFDKNLGQKSLVKQWERCISLTKYEEWIMILGDDDVLDNNVIELFNEKQQTIIRNNISVVRFSTTVIDKNSTVISKQYIHPELEKSTDFFIRKIEGETRSTLSEYIFRKETVETVKFKNLPLAWYSDLLAILEFSNFQYVFSINEATVYFRNSGINITSRRDNLLEKNIASFNFYFKLINQHKAKFTTNQLNIIYSKLEKTLLDNKLNLGFWYKFTKLYYSHKFFKKHLVFFIKALKIGYKNNFK